MAHPDNRQLLNGCIAALQRVFEEFGNRGVIIGGVAVALLGHPRATLDVDAMMLLDTDQVAQLLDVARRYGFQPRTSDPEGFARQTRIVLLEHRPTGIGVDISLGVLPFEIDVVDRAVTREAGNVSVSLASPEDVIILKAVAHRPLDLIDIESLAAACPDLDRTRIERYVREFADALDMPELWDDIAPYFKDQR